MGRLRRRYGHASGAVKESLAWLNSHPITTAAGLGATAGLTAGVAGAAIGTVVGAVAGVVIEEVTKK